MTSSHRCPGRRSGLPLVVVLGLAVGALPGRAFGREVPTGLRPSVEAAIARVRPALVRIRVVSARFQQGREIRFQEVGSGAIISPDGYVITNHHVAGHAVRMLCTLWNREEVDAKLVATDPLTDISVIKLEPRAHRTFLAAAFGDSSKLRVGDYVLAMGSPMALSQSVTLGIVSNTEMTMPKFWGDFGKFTLDGEDVGSLVRWIGHDAAIYGGNSGGPLVNLRGEIVGINEISFGLAGAIPGNLAKRVAEQLIAHGVVERSWLGVSPEPRLRHTDERRGVLVGGVLAGSPASKAGIRAGDLLLKLNGHPTDVRFNEQMPDFMRLAASLPIGKKVSAEILRGGHRKTVWLVPRERGLVFRPEHAFEKWGLTGRDFSFLLAEEMKRKTLDGVLITSVNPGGPAGEARPPMQSQDVLVAVNGTPVHSVHDLVDLTRKLTKGKTDPVPVLAVFERKAVRYLAVVQVGEQELTDPGLEIAKAWLPVETEVISRSLAEQMGTPDLTGFYLTRVYPGTTAAKAGLKPGDFVLAVDQQKLTAADSGDEDELSALIRQYDIGTTVHLSVLRGHERMDVPVTLERSPRLAREMKKYRDHQFDFTARDVSFFDAAEQQWDPHQKGALVADVQPGSWAELGSLYVDDLIEQVDGHPIASSADLKTQMDRVKKTKPSKVIFKVLRGITTVYLELEPEWKR